MKNKKYSIQHNFLLWSSSFMNNQNYINSDYLRHKYYMTHVYRVWGLVLIKFLLLFIFLFPFFVYIWRKHTFFTFTDIFVFWLSFTIIFFFLITIIYNLIKNYITRIWLLRNQNNYIILKRKLDYKNLYNDFISIKKNIHE